MITRVILFIFFLNVLNAFSGENLIFKGEKGFEKVKKERNISESVARFLLDKYLVNQKIKFQPHPHGIEAIRDNSYLFFTGGEKLNFAIKGYLVNSKGEVSFLDTNKKISAREYFDRVNIRTEQNVLKIEINNIEKLKHNKKYSFEIFSNNKVYLNSESNVEFVFAVKHNNGIFIKHGVREKYYLEDDNAKIKHNVHPVIYITFMMKDGPPVIMKKYLKMRSFNKLFHCNLKIPSGVIGNSANCILAFPNTKIDPKPYKFKLLFIN